MDDLRLTDDLAKYFLRKPVLCKTPPGIKIGNSRGPGVCFSYFPEVCGRGHRGSVLTIFHLDLRA